MKLLRYGPKGQERPGIVDDHGEIRDLSAQITDLSRDALSDETLERLSHLDLSSPRLCVSGVGKFLCIGLNYADHAAESGMPIPVEPIVFMKATSCIGGPNDEVIIPRDSTKTDWEVELGVVIGKEAKYLPEQDALAHVVGYCVVNDISERAFQQEGTGQWVKGKSDDSFGRLVPFWSRGTRFLTRRT